MNDLSKALMVLNGLPHVGPVTLNRLLGAFDGDAVKVMQAGRKALLKVAGVGPKIAGTLKGWRQHFDLRRELEILNQHNASFLTFKDGGYPELLKQISDPPIGLYSRGVLELERLRFIAIVGTRQPTLYGQKQAGRFAARLAGAGYCVVSGLARGIDATAHIGALDAGGATVGVLGCGLDVVYPQENAGLYDHIFREGLVLSEFPFGRGADRQTFPMRNRVVAGMCEAVVVVESGSNGGSLITARFAGEQGRQVFVLPGRVDQSTSAGCHQLIRDGATLVTCAEDVIDELGAVGSDVLKLQREVEGANRELPQDLSSGEGRVLEALEGGEVLLLEDVASRTELPVHEVAASMMMLELKRLVAKRADGRFERRG